LCSLFISINPFLWSMYSISYCSCIKFNNSTSWWYYQKPWRKYSMSFLLTGGSKVSGQNVCTFLTCLKVFQMSQKLRVSTRILCSFRICAQKFCICFCSRVVMKSWKGLKKWFGRRINRFLLTPISLFAKVLKIVRVGNFVERTLLYKMAYRTKP
jgi:hypothetical protein